MIAQIWCLLLYRNWSVNFGSFIRETIWVSSGEIALKFGFKSANSAEEHLKALDKKGYIDLHGGTSRGISINKSFLGIPIVGSVAAGSPLLAVENVEERIEFNGNIFSDSVDYFLRVKGDSMNEVGIVEGDLIAINKRKDVKPGDIVVARINDDVTVKTLFHFDKRKVILRPENKNYKDIEINPSVDNFDIEGKCLGVLRNYN